MDTAPPAGTEPGWWWFRWGTHPLLVLPVAFALVWLHGALLGGLDPYYVQRVRPPALWQFLALALPLVAAWAWLAASLYVRWILALPLVALETLSPRRALARSGELTRGCRRPIAVVTLALLAMIVILPILATLIFDRLFTPLLWWLPERNAVLVPATLAYLTAYVLVTLAITFVGIAANALLSACLYLRLAHREPRPRPASRQCPPRAPGLGGGTQRSGLRAVAGVADRQPLHAAR